MNTITEQLVERMLNFNASGRPYDGYPNITGADDGLVFDSAKNAEFDPIVHLCYLASTNAETPEQAQSARAYINAFVQNVWECNMIEGDKPQFAAY